MKDKIITFLLMTLILCVLSVILVFGYEVYKEIHEQGKIEISFENETGFPSIEFIPKKENNNIVIDSNIFSGVEDTTHTVGSKKSRYLYKQLNNNSKIIYDELYNNKDNLKTGTYKVEFGNQFYSLLSQDNGDVELKKDYQSAIEALVYENPEIFYLDVTKMYINIEKITKITGTRYNVYIDNGNEMSYLTDGFYSKEDIEKYENQINQEKNLILSKLEGKNNYDKIKIIHDYLIDTIEYEDTITQEHIYDIYGALVNKKCVCEGYAKTFQYLMNEIGVDNTLVIGIATNSRNQTENHAWNYVKLNEEWYAVDVTWDDPIITGNGKLTNKMRYKYFLKGSKTLGEKHISSGKFTDNGKVFEYPILSVEDYE